MLLRKIIINEGYKVLLLAIPFFLSGLFYGYGQTASRAADNSEKVRTIIVIFDALRPDYIRPDWMPRLSAFRSKAAYGNNHHSVFPTVTRVNAASYITGSYPVNHGLMGNSLYIPEVNPAKSESTGNADFLRQVMEATSGNLLTSPSLGEILHLAGEEFFVYSSGSTGQAFLQNHRVKGAIIHPEMILPESFKHKVIEDIGEPPGEGVPNTSRHRWITDALCKFTLRADGPLVSAIWYSDPDAAAHKYGIGVPVTVEALKIVDAAFGSILDSIYARGLENRFNIVVTADHGFVTHSGKEGLTDFLIRKGFKKDKDSDDIIVAGGAVYVKDRNRETVRNVVAALQKESWAGAVYTKAKKQGSLKGEIKGTLSFNAVHWNHSYRAADVLVSVAWDDRKNEQGFAGTDFATGVAGHGGSSPYEIHIALMAYGPSFKSSVVTHLPTSNIDIVPTILAYYGLKAPETMQGRIINEILKDRNSHPEKSKKKSISVSTGLHPGKYTITMEYTKLGTYRYVDAVGVRRTY